MRTVKLARSLAFLLALLLSGCGEGENQGPASGENGAASIAFHGDTAQISGPGAAFSNGTLTIRQPGTYVLSGALENGQVYIDAGKNDVIRLALNGVSLHNETGPAIYAPKSKEVILVLETGTQNTVSDGPGYAGTGKDDPDAAIFVQDDLRITGEGALTVAGVYKHGVRAQDVLTVTGGTVNVNAAGDALRGRDGVVIQNGDFTLEAGGDGIQSNNAGGGVGSVAIHGGTFHIQAQNDGIQAESALTVAGGRFEIKTGGGNSAPAREKDTPQSAEEASVSRKALKAGTLLSITGGEFIIDAEDDAVHANDRVVVTSGSLFIQTGDDGIHADNAVEITGGEIHIPVCYEGIEGLSVTIGGGNISVTAQNDAVNAAGGADNVAVNGDIFVRISGGTIDLYATHDGIDSNGDIFMEGGALTVSGPSREMEGAIDLDGSMTVTGGTLITAGSVVNASPDSTQPVVLMSYAQQQASGSVIMVEDLSGNILLEYTSKTAYSMSGFTSPSFEIGETYTLFIDGEKRCDIRLDSVVTGLSDDGGAYNGGRGGGN